MRPASELPKRVRTITQRSGVRQWGWESVVWRTWGRFGRCSTKRPQRCYGEVIVHLEGERARQSGAGDVEAGGEVFQPHAGVDLSETFAPTPATTCFHLLGAVTWLLYVNEACFLCVSFHKSRESFTKLTKGSSDFAEASTPSMEVVEASTTPIEAVEASVEVVEATLRLHGSSGIFLYFHASLWKSTSFHGSSGSSHKLPWK